MLRPDEQAMRSQIAQNEEFNHNVSKGVKSAAGLGLAAASGPAASRILPLLSSYVPTDLAMKGLSKVSPKLHDFLKRGMSYGLNVEDGIQYLREKFEQPEKEEPAKQNKNIIEKYSPELHQFITDQMQAGHSPLQAGALAMMERKGQKSFKSVIDKMVADHKVPFQAILETAYGQEQKAQPEQQQQQQTQPQGGEGVDPELEKIIQGGAALLKKYRG